MYLVDASLVISLYNRRSAKQHALAKTVLCMLRLADTRKSANGIKQARKLYEPKRQVDATAAGQAGVASMCVQLTDIAPQVHVRLFIDLPGVHNLA
jgi:hypothetical protein